jgi:DNA-binding TFAR19-related protein (PDSD5 family)
MYCIYCGSSLSEENMKKGPIIDARKKISSAPTISPYLLPDSIELKPETEPRIASGYTGLLEPETAHKIRELRKYHIWRIKLCEILVERRVSQDIFEKVYTEYSKEITELEGERQSKLSQFQRHYNEKTAKLIEVKSDYEELKIRASVGQILSETLENNAPKMLERIDALTSEIELLTERLNKLTDLLDEVPLDEIEEVGGILSLSLESLESLVTDGVLNTGLKEKLRRDLEDFKEIFAASGYYHYDKALMEEMDIIEARYKVGEISTAEKEGLKKEILKRFKGS